mmetsp:Transcript_40952/g.103166  ORF Transcript_40952/g.103166 Transcript_40952/m.103166 type:complete len:206 (-) Transcript_40952:310-927(-)
MDFHAKVNVRNTLMCSRCTDHIDVIREVAGQRFGAHTTAHFDEKVFVRELGAQCRSRRGCLFRTKVVQHHYAGTGVHRLHGIIIVATLHLDLHREATHLLGRFHCAANRSGRSNVVVLDHHHAAEIHAMGIHAANHHGILLHQAEEWCGFARSGYHALELVLLTALAEGTTARGDTTGTGQHIECHPLCLEKTVGRAFNGAHHHW